MEKLYIVSNESIFEENGKFFCDNIDLKSTPEGLNHTFEVHLFGRSSKIERAHNIKLKYISISNNFFSYLLNIFKSLSSNNSKYLIISITPYTFLITVFLRLFKKKTSVYLRSDGYSEYKAILGFLGKFIYHVMFIITSNISALISCRKFILRGKHGEIVSPSQLNSNWLVKVKKPNFKKIKLLYVGRMRKEKGIFSLLKIIKEIKAELSLTIVGAEKNFDFSNLKKNINLFSVENNEKKLIEYYDNHSIFILPSFTEGHPMVLLEALSRFRPIIIFNEIKHVTGTYEGIFPTDRNHKSLLETINYIKYNINSILTRMKKNNLPTHDQFIKDLTKIIKTK